jgi:hypothetical protein
MNLLRLVALGVFLACLFFSRLNAAELTGRVVDSKSGEPVAARIYLTDTRGNWFFVESAAPEGSAVRYDKTNWLRKESLEKHTTISAHPFKVQLPPGDYTLMVERGKEYFAKTTRLHIGKAGANVEVKLRRWINMAQRGWYSGETHIHRTLQELPNIIQSEDLNVAMPLTYWVTLSDTAPTSGNKNIGGEIPEGLIQVDPTHVIWPRNTEYEIFSVGKKRHTLGALFFLNHKSVLKKGVPPWGPIARAARREGTLLDMDKLDWPFSMTLPHSTGARLYELANNHMWRTQFAFSKWNSQTTGFLQPPTGAKGGGEEDWINYTLGQYYTLLNAGFALVPTAGTANGVHPVPAGFSRVYVHLPKGFSYANWIEGLKKGRSFVTTGPMLFAKVNGQLPGAKLVFDKDGGELNVTGKVISENRITNLEFIVNGQPVKYLRGRKPAPEGAHQLSFSATLPVKTSGWVCIRSFEERPDGRLRFAHTAPWRMNVPGKPLRPSPEEKEYLVERVQREINRSQGIVSSEAMAEYTAALKHYQNLPTREVPTPEARQTRDEAKLKGWLENMVAHHRFTPHEVRAATGLPLRKIKQKLKDWNLTPDPAPKWPIDAPLKVLPYPGGRHPRIGFLEGALVPQRDTKISVFTPWNSQSYVVIDVPEAIWSNLGLTYLAHTHIPTVWDKHGKKLPPLEWQHNEDDSLQMERALPNGVVFGTRVVPQNDAVKVKLWIRNGSGEKLTGLRAQVCVMLKGALGFHQRIGANKIIEGNWVACRDADGKRWIITGWEPIHRPWQNPPVPCLHADPSFPDCPPGKTVEANGIVSFFEGEDAKRRIAELRKKYFPNNRK